MAAWRNDRRTARDAEGVTAYRERAPDAARAHPTEEHFLPLMVAIGASDDDDAIDVIEGGMTYGVLSMESYVFGRLD